MAQKHPHLPKGAQDARIPGGNKIGGSRASFRPSSMTVIPGTSSYPVPGRPSTAASRGTGRGHLGMPEADRQGVSKAKARGLTKGHAPMG